jgi:ABC-type polysaccharide/polyol phosphate export permease
MYAFFALVLAIIAAIGLALIIGIVMALREDAGTPRH